MSIFNVLTNVARAGIAICVSPVALVADIVTLPASAEDLNRGAFDRTGKVLSEAGECLMEAISPDRGRK